MGKEKQSNYRKKINLKNLIEHNLIIYDKNKDINKLKNTEQQLLKYKKEIEQNLLIFEEYEKEIIVLESYIKNTFSSLRKKAEEKLNILKVENKIKKIIIEYYNQYNNFIIINNIISLLSTILDFNDLNLLNDKNESNLNKAFDIIKSFLQCEKYKKISLNPIKFFDEFILTKSYSNKNNIILWDKDGKEGEIEAEIFDSFYSNIININFETEEAILYNILADFCSAEKISPIQFNHNIIQKSINEQEILIYNIRNDKYLYYGIYNIEKKCIIKNSLIQLVDEKIENFKLISLNNGLDIFFIGKTKNEIMKNKIIYCYLNNFRTKLNYKKYEINRENYDNLEIINNGFTVCIKCKQRLILISKNIKKEINYLDELFDIEDITHSLFKINNHKNNENFQNNKGGKKTFLKKIIYLNNNYFLSIYTKHFKNINQIINNYFYLSLFDFTTLEEITKIEIKRILKYKIKKDISISKCNNIFKLSIAIMDSVYEYYHFEFKNGELIEINNENNLN